MHVHFPFLPLSLFLGDDGRSWNSTISYFPLSNCRDRKHYQSHFRVQSPALMYLLLNWTKEPKRSTCFGAITLHGIYESLFFYFTNHKKKYDKFSGRRRSNTDQIICTKPIIIYHKWGLGYCYEGSRTGRGYSYFQDSNQTYHWTVNFFSKTVSQSRNLLQNGKKKC
jgi:hypothetical protein